LILYNSYDIIYLKLFFKIKRSEIKLMIKCVNQECENSKYELEEEIEVCPLCGKPTEKIETSLDVRRPLGAALSIAAILGIVVSMLPFGGWIPFYLGCFTIVACIVTSIIIRMKVAIIISILSAAAMVGVLFYYGAL